MSKDYLLGIDIGTSACKVAIFNKNGKVMASANGDYPVYYPHEGWAQQKPDEWTPEGRRERMCQYRLTFTALRC